MDSTMLCLILWGAGTFDRWELTTWEWRVGFFAEPGPATGKVKVILLDRNSLDWGKTQNKWSWPWEVYGPIIDFCKRGGARAVVFDVLFTEPSLYGVQDDKVLAAIGRAPASVGAMPLGAQEGEATAWPEEIPAKVIPIRNIDNWIAGAGNENVSRARAYIDHSLLRLEKGWFYMKLRPLEGSFPAHSSYTLIRSGVVSQEKSTHEGVIRAAAMARRARSIHIPDASRIA